MTPADNKGLEPGGLAMIVGYTRVPDNVGKVVELVRLVRPDEVVPELMDQGSGIFIGDIPGWLVVGDGLVRCQMVGYARRYIRSNYLVCQPRHLMPLRNNGEQQHRQVQAKTPAGAGV